MEHDECVASQEVCEECFTHLLSFAVFFPIVAGVFLFYYYSLNDYRKGCLI